MGTFGNLFCHYLSNEQASIMPMAAGLIPVIIGMAGIGVDVSSWVMTKRNLQTAADAAVVAAAWEVANGFEDYAEFAATKEAQANGYVSEEGGKLNLNIDEIDGTTVVTASITQKADVYFSRMFLSGDIYLANAAASAVILENDGEHCMLSLEEEADGAMLFNGSVTIEAEGCGLAVNSTSDEAIVTHGKGSLNINVGEISSAGDLKIDDINIKHTDFKPRTGKIKDPYADVEVPEGDTCYDHKGTTLNNKQPLTYPSTGEITTFCGGLNIKGDVTFPPGVYIIDGGDFDVTGTVSGVGVTFIITNSDGGDVGGVTLRGGGEINISAPTPEDELPIEGIAIYQVPSENGDTADNSIMGNTEFNIQGVVYMPGAELEMGGNSSSATAEGNCSHYIAKTIWMHGNPNMGNNCADKGVRPIGSKSSRVKLIL